jgi:isopenicillin-N N-acyltransferase-like protein
MAPPPPAPTRREFLGATALAGLGAVIAVGRRAAAAPPPPFPELVAAGKPAALGRAHGRAFAARIEHNVAFYRRWLGELTGASAPQLLAAARGFGAALGSAHPALLEEIEGIARGAGRPRDEILLLNARTDLLAACGRRPAPAAGECTAVALPGRGRDLALGQTWDWYPVPGGGPVVLRLRPAHGPRLVTFAEAGMLAKIGFNEHRLGVCLNFLGHADDAGAARGVPVHALLRAVLGCRTLGAAEALVRAASRSASVNLLLAQPGPRGGVAGLEVTPARVARLAADPAGVVHANHFKAAGLAPGCAGGGGSSSDRDRLAGALARELRVTVPDPVARAQRILAARRAPHAVSVAPGEADTPTLAGVVMDLRRNRLLLTAGPPHLHPWVARPGV